MSIDCPNLSLKGKYRVELQTLSAYHLHEKTRKFQLENQMIRIIRFGTLLKLWAFGQNDAFLLLLLGSTADVYTFCMLSIFC